MGAQPWWRAAAAEFVGVFTLVFVGAGAVVTLTHFNTLNGGDATTVIIGVALAHGLAIAVMVTALGHLSGGHFNPAVTLAAMATRRMPPPIGLLYMAAQILGGVFGAILLVASLPADWWQPAMLGTPLLGAGIDPAKGVLIEAALTFILVIVIFGAAMDQRHPNWGVAGFAIGLTITLAILMGAPLTGPALNPARAFSTALVAQSFGPTHYVYWVGPILGGIVAGLVYDLAFVETKVKPSKIPPAPTPETPAEPLPPASEPVMTEPDSPMD